jgi:hypothetical protein
MAGLKRGRRLILSVVIYFHAWLAMCYILSVTALSSWLAWNTVVFAASLTLAINVPVHT